MHNTLVLTWATEDALQKDSRLFPSVWAVAWLPCHERHSAEATATVESGYNTQVPNENSCSVWPKQFMNTTRQVGAPVRSWQQFEVDCQHSYGTATAGVAHTNMR